MFNKKQLVVMWITALIVSTLIYTGSITRHRREDWWRYGSLYYYTVDYFKLSIIPIIIGGVVILTIRRKD